jgi:cardiolipin synthase
MGWLEVLLDFIYQNLWLFLIVFYYFIVTITIVSLLLQNTNPIKTLTYIIALLTLPVIGLIVYYFLGQDYRKDKLFSIKGVVDNQWIKKWMDAQIISVQKNHLLTKEVMGRNVKVATHVFRANNSIITTKNRVKVLKSGDEKFDALIKQISGAESFIYMEYYIIEDDRLGSGILNLLEEKARNGVQVRFIYDDVGSSDLSSARLKSLKNSGVSLFPFMPVRFPVYSSKLNFRDHRKIAVIDGKVGFIGGINIAERYSSRFSPKNWRDTHLMIEGEAVRSLIIVFLLNWKFVSGEVPELESKIFEPFSNVDDQQLVQFAFSGPDSDWASIMLSFITAISMAEEKVYLQSPYFIPTESLITALTSAAQTGVNVKLMLPGKSDARITQWAGESYYSPLLEAGVEIFLYQDGFLHAKTIIVDDLFSSVGTANLDYRSFNTNFEVNCLIYDKGVTNELNNMFLEDLKHCIQVDAERWHKRPWNKRLVQSLSRPLSPLL